MLDADLNVTAPAPPPGHSSPFGQNCIDLKVVYPLVMNATANWDAQTPLAQRLTLRAFDHSGRSDLNTSASPARLHFVENGTDGVTIGVFVPNGLETVEQAVRLHIEYFLVDAPGEQAIRVTAEKHNCPG